MIRGVIAEAGSVHDGSFGNACKLIELAAACGASTVKFQTHIAEAETLADAPSPPYFKGEPRFDYFRRTAFSEDRWHQLAACARANRVAFISSPFSEAAVDLLDRVGVDAFKIPSGEVTNLPMLARIAATGRPAILSSGMSDWAQLDAAVATLRPGGELMVMQCSSIYPCPPERAGVNLIPVMAGRYSLPVGFSDHSLGCAAAVAAATLGASAVEKHITFSRHMYGSDAPNATEPQDFARYCSELAAAWAMLASPVDKDDLSPYREMKRIFEKSVVTAVPVSAGCLITQDMLAFKKPGDGISAARWQEVAGRRARRDLPADHLIAPEDFA